MNLATLASVQKLQTALHAKAKEAPGYRFYALYDKMYRKDVLAFAYHAAEPMAVRREQTGRPSRRLRRTGWSGGWTNWRRS